MGQTKRTPLSEKALTKNKDGAYKYRKRLQEDKEVSKTLRRYKGEPPP